MKPKAITFAIFSAAALAAALPAAASTFTVSGSGATFTVARSGEGTNAAETVLFRTVPLSAFPGQHYTEKSDTLVFAPGQTTTNIAVSENSPSIDAYKYQTSASRSYRFELTDPAGAYLAHLDRTVTSGLSQFSAAKVSSSVADLVTLTSGGAFSSGMPSGKFLDVSFTPASGNVETSGTLKGYVLIDDSYDYSKKPATVSTATLIDSTGATASYLNSLGYKICATVCFAEKEKDDGYQYLQIVAGTANSSYDTGPDPNAKVNDPTNSVYKVCFEFADGSNAEGNIFFPHRYTSNGEFSNSNGKLHQQKYRSNDYNGSGAVVLPVTTTTITARFDAGGDNDDTWGYKDFFVRMALRDATAPTIAGDPVVSLGPYGAGTTVYISVPFSEIVTVSGTPYIHTDWGDYDYFSGSGSNVLTFKGTIPATFGASLITRNLGGTITDLAGNALSGTSCYKSFSGVTVALPWGGSGTSTDPYVITRAAQLDYMAVRVNADYGNDSFSGKYFVLADDITYTHTTDWNDYNGRTSENNFTPIGRYGRSFQGHFDGQGHTISGIRVWTEYTLADNSNESLGLFGYVSGGSVSNVILRDANIRGLKNMGGIVGYLIGGSVTGCTLYQVLVGSHAKANMATGMGIVIGYSGGTVTDCYYRDCVKGLTYQDGHNDVTLMPHPERWDNVYDITLASGVSATYVSGTTVTIDAATYYTEGCTFTLAYNGTIPAGSVQDGYTNTYTITEGLHTNTYHYRITDATLTVPAADCSVGVRWAPAWEGDGTAEAPYLIRTTDDLDLLAKMVNGRSGYGYSDFSGTYFVLGNDITYTHTTDWDNADGTENNYTAIGGWRSGSTYNQFCGDFDGDGHTISGIRIYKNSSGTANGYTGLFGYVGTSGTVHDVTLADARITGRLSVAGIVGQSYGTVTNCTVAADVCVASKNTNSDYHAGIVGKNYGSVSGCTSAVTLTADYAGPDDYGAVVGWNSTNGSITNCLALGATIPAMADNYGVIVGYNNNGTLTANYYRACTVGTATNAVDAGVGRSGGAPADTDGARSVHLLRTGSSVSATGGETVVIGGLAHYAAGGAVALAYDGTPAAGTEFAGFVVADENGGASFETDGAFAMPAYDATADALILTEWAALNRRLAAGGDITLAKDYAATAEDTYLTVPAGVAVTLDLSGHILDRNLAAATNNGFVIDVRGSLAVTDGAPAATHTGALAGIPGGVITGGNSTDNGGGVIVNGSAATFTLSGGAVSGNTASRYGGGVYVDSGSFTLSGGTVTGNAAGDGGGVYLYSGTVTLSGGAVSENDASGYGGGVDVFGGTATLSGGVVSKNTAKYGGGVDVSGVGGGTFTLSGGEVSENYANYSGGGVYVNEGAFTLSDGAISDNTAARYGGGVYVKNGSGVHFQIGGGPVVSGNAVEGAPNNVYLRSGRHIDVVGELTASARLGVTAADGLGVFTDGLGARGGAGNFFSDDPAWRVRVDGSGGEAELFVPDAFYAVVIGESAHGAVTASVNGSVARQAAAGDAVVLSADQAQGYGLRGVVVTNAAGEAVAVVPGTGENAGGFVFEMPAASVGVEPAFEAVYPVTIADGVLHGTVVADRAAAFAGDVVTVTVAPDEGYAFGSVAVADANGDPVLLIAQDGRGAQFEMPVGGAVVSARFAAYVPASYVDEDGEEYTGKAILLEDWITRLEAGVYVVTGEVACAGGVEVRGYVNVTLILADGCALRIGTPEAPLDGLAIDANGCQLAIYGQAGGTGRLEIHNENGEGISAWGYAQHGGSVFVRTSGDYPCIYAENSVVLDGGSLDVESEFSGYDIYAGLDIRILGGRLSASGGGVLAQDSITLGHRSPADSIYAADYYCVNAPTINDGQALTDGTNVFTWTVNANEVAGKTLTPAYWVSVGLAFDGGQGGVTLDKNCFAAGETVAPTIVPDSGSALGSLDVYYYGDDGNPVAVAVTNNAFTMPARDVRVHARFVPGYTVSFLPGEGGGEMASVAVPQDTWYTLPDCGFAEPEGKMFVGWLSGSGNSFRPGEEQQIDGDWTLTAIFAGYRTVTIAGDGADGVQTEWNWWDATVSEYGFAGVATGGVVRFPCGANLNFTGLPLFIDSDPALDYDANGGIYSLADATNDVTIAIIAFPSYLAGADYVVTNNYLAWAAKYGSDADGSRESFFLLDLPPWTEMPEGAALLKIVEMGVTNIPTASDYGMIAMAMGYQGEELPCRRLVLASDVAQLKRREDFDTPFEACNGYLVLRIGGDLAAPLDEWAAASWLVEFENGRGEFVFPEIFLEGIRGNLERAAGKPLGGLFLRPCISPVPRLEWLSNLGVLIEGP